MTSPARGIGRDRAGAVVVARRYVFFVIGVVVVVLALLYIPSITSPRSSASPSAVTFTPAGAPGSAGTAVSGVKCGPGVRQVTWSKYAPICEPAYHGNNGGATSPGVTGNTITITFREAESAEEQALYSSVAPSIVGTNQSTIATMQAYIDEFNKTFELYGRHVVLKPFQGKGDFLQEDEGLDTVEAQADAVTAKSLGAFADISILASTQAYDQALAQQKIIAIGGIEMPQSWFAQYAPYEYSPWPNCDKAARTSAIVIGKSMAGMDAVYAGDPSLQAQKRVFGVVYPEIPAYAGCAQEAVQYLQKHYGVHIKADDIDPIELNLSTLSEQASTIVERWKQDGVTSVLCACDPISPIYLTAAASTNGYHPEWFSFNIGDAFGRLPAQNEWDHAVSGGFASQPKSQQEAYRVYKLADPNGTPSPSFYYLYEPLLLFFDALQAAGPDLNPQTFAAGMAKLPPSEPNGMYGQWIFGPHVYDPVESFGLLWWDPTAISVADGKPGAWLPCNGGATYLASNGAKGLPDHKQLSCFGKSPSGRAATATTSTTAPNPFATTTTAPNPFATTTAPNPFATTTAPNPFATTTTAPNPFATTTAPNPFATTTTTVGFP